MRNRRGQSTAEYAILVAVVVAAVVGMQLYVKRGMQAKTKDVTDVLSLQTGDIGGTDAPAGITISTNMTQYEPYYTADGTMAVSSGSAETEQFIEGGQVQKTAMTRNQNRTGNQNMNVNQVDDNIWDGSQ